MFESKHFFLVLGAIMLAQHFLAPSDDIEQSNPAVHDVNEPSLTPGPQVVKVMFCQS